MKIGLFDTHAHLNDNSVFSTIKTIQNIIKDCEKNSVVGVICCATNLEDTKTAFNLSCVFSNIYCTAGIHPLNSSRQNLLNLKDINYIKKISKFKKMVAIGEIGLDFIKIKSEEEKKIQKKLFIQQIDLADKLKKPIIVHTRGSHQETKKILSMFPNVKGVIHCFSGSYKDAQDYIKLGYYISFSGIITFKNSFEIRKVVEKLSINKILIETDSPYLAPQIVRGSINNPNNVKYIAKQISTIKKINYNDIVEITCLNAYKVFNIINK